MREVAVSYATIGKAVPRVEGAAKVYRQPADPKAKETLVYEKPLLTDAHGRALLDWTATKAGYYRVAFSARDTAGLPVEGSTYVWIAGAELTRGEFLTQGVFLAVENPYYQEGQTARLLIRPFEHGDADAWIAMFSDPEVRRFLLPHRSRRWRRLSARSSRGTRWSAKLATRCGPSMT